MPRDPGPDESRVPGMGGGGAPLSRAKRERDADAFMAASVSVYPASSGGDVRLIVEGRTFVVTGRLAKGLRALAAGTLDDSD